MHLFYTNVLGDANAIKTYNLLCTKGFTSFMCTISAKRNKRKLLLSGKDDSVFWKAAGEDKL